jgi:hypothetical protein
MSLSLPKMSDQPSVTERTVRAANRSQAKDAVTALTTPDSAQDEPEPKDDILSSPPSSLPQKPPSLPPASQTTLPLTFDISTMAARIQVPKLKLSSTGASNVTAWRNHLIPLVRSSGVAAHLGSEVRLASQEQPDLEKTRQEPGQRHNGHN